jgi:hypothetical protein
MGLAAKKNFRGPSIVKRPRCFWHWATLLIRAGIVPDG